MRTNKQQQHQQQAQPPAQPSPASTRQAGRPQTGSQSALPLETDSPRQPIPSKRPKEEQEQEQQQQQNGPNSSSKAKSTPSSAPAGTTANRSSSEGSRLSCCTSSRGRGFNPRRADWISRVYPPGYKAPTSIDSVKAFGPPNVDEIVQASEIAMMWAASRSSTSTSTIITPDDMRTFALYSFDFGATPLNDRSPQAVLNKALASRTTLDLLNLRGFLFNVLFSLRKLPRIDSSTHKNLCLYAPVRADSVFGGFPLRTLLTAAPTFRLTQPKHCSNSGNASSIELLGSLEELCPDCAREVQAREAQMLMGCVFVAPAFAYAFTDEDEALDALQKPEPFYSAVKDPEFVGTLITISGPNVWCYDIEPYSVFPAQSRVILEPDRMFRIVSVAFENKLRRITVEMLNTPVLLCDLIPPQIQQRTFSPEPQPQLPQQQPQQVSQKPTTSKAPVSPRKQQQQQQQQPSPPASQTTTQPVHTETAKGTTTTVVNNATTSSDNSQQKEKCISPDPKQQQAQQNVQTTPAKQAKSEESVPPNNITNNEAPKEPEAGKAAEEQPAVVVDCGNGKETRGRADEEVEGNDRKEINDLLALIVDKKSKARGIVANVCKELYSKVSDEENSEKNQIIFVTANGIQGLLETFKRFSPFDRDIFLNMCFVFSYVIKEKCASESIFIESDGVSTVLAGYESFYADPECCRLMTNAISMFFFESAVGSATDKDAISLFAKALKLHEGYPDTRLEVCRLLTTFAQRSDKAKDAIFKAIDIAYLFSLISKYPNDVLLINQIFGIFTVLTEKIPTIESILVEQGNIIPTLISYIKKPALFDARTPCYFCTIIVKLSYNDDYKQRLVSGGCIAAVKQFIQNNIKRPELSACGCSALDCLSKKGTASKKSSFAGSPGVNNYFFLLKTNKYDRETYASIFEAMAIVISANREKARVVTQNGGIQILTNVAMRFVDSSTSTNRVVFSGFIALMDVILRSLIEIKELRSLEDNAKPLFTLFYRAVKEFAESANELHMASFILYALTESFPQEITPKQDNVKVLLNAVRLHVTDESVCLYILSVVRTLIERDINMISFMNCVDVLVEVLREWSASSCKVCAVALHILMFEAQRPKLKEQIIRSDNFTSILECVSTNIKEGKVCTPFCVMIECLVENSPEIRDAFNKDGRVVSLINNIYLKNPASDTFLDVIEASLQCLGKRLPNVDAIQDDMNGSSSSSSRINNDSTRCDEAKLGDVSRGADGNALDKVMSVASGDDSMKGYLNYLDDEASKSRKISCRSNYEKPISSFLKDVKSRDVKRVRDASSALWTLAGNSESEKMTIIQLDGIQIGFDTIRNYQTNQAICENILKMFDTFPFYKNSCLTFIENGGIKNLIEIIKRKQASHFTIGHACVTLSLFATNNFYISVDSIKDCINAILYAIKQVVNTESCKIVSNVLSEVVIYSNKKGQVTSILEGQLNLIISILRKRIDCPETCSSLCTVLNSFALDHTNKDALGVIVLKKELIPLLFQVIDMHSANPDVCKVVCKTLISLEINDLTKTEFFKKKRLNKIISIMKMNSTNYDLITACLFAINHAVTTIQREKQNIKEVTQNMNVFIDIFKGTIDDATTCSTFLNMFIKVDLNALVQYDGLDIVIDSLIKHKDQVIICNDIFFILYSVTDKNEKGMETVMKSKDFPEVLRIASALISNKELVQRAIAIIYNLLVNNKDPEVLGAAGAVDFIVEAFKAYSTDAVLGTWACAVLSLFSKSEKDVRLFIEKGGFVSFFKMYRYSFDAIDFCDKVMNSTAALCMTNFPNFPGTDPILAEIMDLTFEVLDRNKTRMPTCGYASIIMSLILRFPLKNNKLFFFGSAACGGGGSSSSSSSSNNNGDATTANTNSSSEGGEAISLKKKVSLLLGVLKRHEESKELSEKLTLMFCNLFINALPGERPSKEVEAVEVEIAKHIGEEGGVELILDILKRYMGISVAVCENATAALQNLTVWKGNLERIVKAGGTNIVLQGLREIPADKLQAKGFLQTLYKTVTALSPQKQSQQQAEGSETTKLTPSII